MYMYILLVCLYVTDKRQNGWTDRAQICYGTALVPIEGLFMYAQKSEF